MFELFIERTNETKSRLNSKGTPQKLFSSCRAGNTRRQKHQKSVDYQALEVRKVLAATFPAFIGGQLELGDAENTSPYQLNQTFQLESRPNSDKTIYLDFDGHRSSNNAWNHSINFPAYNTSGSSSSFSKSELIQIQTIFQNVAEDFLPFDVNVTTRDPGVDSLARRNGSDSDYGIRVLMTQHTGNFGAGTGGLARRNSFMDRRDTPVFVFNKGLNDAAWTASHEVGHSLGLTHDGLYGKTYHPGTGTGETGWGPIMGGAFGKSLTQWSDGSYAGSDNHQDDLSVITRGSTGVNFRGDDVGNTFGTAKKLNLRGNSSGWGIIGSRDDVDVYQFTVDRSDVSLSVKPFQGKGNLDVLAKLYSSKGDLLATSNPTDLVSASIEKTLPAGKYYLSIDGVGRSGRYSDYGSLGFYSIAAKANPKSNDLDRVDRDVVGESGNLHFVDDQWRRVELQTEFAEPVVIAGPASTNDAQAGVVRVRNVTSESFEIRIQNWDYLQSLHRKETVSYLVVESGSHQLSDGTKFVAGNGYLSHQFRRIGFGSHFESRPVVFSQVVSNGDESSVAARVNGVGTGSFGILLQEEEANDGRHAVEKFSWLAIEEADSHVKGLQVKGNGRVNHVLGSEVFRSHFTSRPVFLAGLQTKLGDDPATLRTRSVSQSRADIFLQEEKSRDSEVTHVVERFGYAVLRPGIFYAKGDDVSGSELGDLDKAFEETGPSDSLLPTRRSMDFAILDALQSEWLAEL